MNELENETVNALDNEINENEDDYFDPNFFQCPKCDSEFTNNDAEYQYCKFCIRGFCRNCSSICDVCLEKKCFRCVEYLECCDKSLCKDCGTFYCEECNDDHCRNCVKMYNCKNCEYNTCTISKDHFLNTYCTNCANEFCITCDDPSFSNHCYECLLDIESVLEIKNVPFGVLDNIIDYLEPDFRPSLNEYLADNPDEDEEN
jgi:hypothetical protein